MSAHWLLSWSRLFESLTGGGLFLTSEVGEGALMNVTPASGASAYEYGIWKCAITQNGIFGRAKVLFNMMYTLIRGLHQ